MAMGIHIRRICETAGLLIFLAVWLGCPAGFAAEPKRVLILHSFGRDFKPWKDYASSIRSELERQSPWPLDIQDQSLVSARSSNSDPEVPFIEYLRALYSKNPPDLIVGIGAPAAVFVQQHRHQIFPKAPMVFTAMEERRIDVAALTEFDSVVAMTHDFAAAIENILRVLPDTKNIMVVNGYSPNERFWLEEIRREVKPLEGRVAFTWTSHLSFEEILKLASELPPHSAIFWHTLYVDGAGVGHEGDSALRELHAIAKAPIFSLFDVFFDGETVGGPMHSMLEEAQETAAVAIRILNGEKAGDIKVPPTRFATPKFDWREMQRWGISEKNLPPGSEILFRPPTAWEQYRWQILSVAAVVLTQALLIMGLLYEHQRRRRAEVQSLQRMSALAHMNRIATVSALTASIAHEIKQPLTAIVTWGGSGLRWLGRQVPDVEEVRANLHKMIDAANRASAVMDELRAMFRKDNNRQTLVDVNGLILDTVSLANHEIKAKNVSVQTELFESSELSVLADRVQLQQVILNLIANAIEAMNSMPDARALRITSALHNADGVLITVEDSGPGIAPENLDKVFDTFFTTKATGMGMGLSICRSIIEAHGGRLWVSRVAPHGCIFHIVLPKKHTLNGPPIAPAIEALDAKPRLPT